MTDEQVERVAREWCRLAGLDADELVGHGAKPDARGFVPSVWLQSPRERAMADKDWRGGKLLGAGYVLVVAGKVYAASPEKAHLRAMWEKAGSKFASKTPFPEQFVKQVCFILPPWETDDD